MRLTTSPPFWYMTFWSLMLVGWGCTTYVATRYAVLWALKAFTIWERTR